MDVGFDALSMVRNWLPPAGASAALLSPSQQHVAVGIPQLMTTTEDYVLRLDPDEAYVPKDELNALGLAAQDRAAHFMIERPFGGEIQLDTCYARSVAEYAYAARLSELGWATVPDTGAERVASTLVLANDRSLLPGRMPELRSGASRSEYSYYAPITLRRWEARMRNKHGYFVPYYMREATVLRFECFSAKYLRCPAWWKA